MGIKQRKMVMDIVNTFNENPLEYIDIERLADDCGHEYMTVRKWIEIVAKEKALDLQKLENTERFDESLEC